MSQTEIQERAARLNTQLRFGKRKEALSEAYKLRTFIQLCGYQNEETARELQRAEKVIAELEKAHVSGIQKLVDMIVRTINRSLNPEVDTDDDTLLDRFEEKLQADVAEFDQESKAQMNSEPPKAEAWLGSESEGHHFG